MKEAITGFLKRVAAQKQTIFFWNELNWFSMNISTLKLACVEHLGGAICEIDRTPSLTRSTFDWTYHRSNAIHSRRHCWKHFPARPVKFLMWTSYMNGCIHASARKALSLTYTHISFVTVSLFVQPDRAWSLCINLSCIFVLITIYPNKKNTSIETQALVSRSFHRDIPT